MREVLHRERSAVRAAIALVALLGLTEALLAAAPVRDLEREPGEDILAYRFDLVLDPEVPTITGSAWIELACERCERLVLDLVGGSAGEGGSEATTGSQLPPSGMTVVAVSGGFDALGTTEDRRSYDRVERVELAFEHHNDRLSIDLTDLAAGPGVEERREVLVRVDYSGRPAEGLVMARNRHGEGTIFADNWPDRARHWLPVRDHPSDKARCGFRVTAPAIYQVVGCGSLLEETDLEGGLRRTTWQSDAPIATKVMAVGVARFAVEKVGQVGSVPVTSWVYPQDREAGWADFAPALDILEFFDRRLGTYPWAKLANVQSTTRWGGLENAGNPFYREAAVTGEGKLTGLLAHEIAHQWFGDSLTEETWNHVWLSEGFATYLAALYQEETEGAAALRETLERARRVVVRQASERTVVVQLESEADVDLETLLGPHTYQRGAWVLHMLRRQVGDRLFWRGLRTFHERFRHRNASSLDFESVMEEVAGRNLDAFFEQWLRREELPRLRARTTTLPGRGGRQLLVLEQLQEKPMNLEVEVGFEGAPDLRLVVPTDERTTRVRLPRRRGGELGAVVLDPFVNLLFVDETGARSSAE